MDLWRAVDGEVLDVLVQSRRDKQAAVKLMRKLLNSQVFAPAFVVTDKLGSYGAALRKFCLKKRHVTGGRANNRANNSHQPTGLQDTGCDASSHPVRHNNSCPRTLQFTTP